MQWTDDEDSMNQDWLIKYNVMYHSSMMDFGFLFLLPSINTALKTSTSVSLSET